MIASAGLCTTEHKKHKSEHKKHKKYAPYDFFLCFLCSDLRFLCSVSVSLCKARPQTTSEHLKRWGIHERRQSPNLLEYGTGFSGAGGDSQWPLGIFGARNCFSQAVPH